MKSSRAWISAPRSCADGAAEAATSHLAVLGSPIAHSKSPAIHAAAYRELGLAWSYGREELRAEELEGFLEHLAREVHDDGLRRVLEAVLFTEPSAAASAGSAFWAPAVIAAIGGT